MQWFRWSKKILAWENSSGRSLSCKLFWRHELITFLLVYEKSTLNYISVWCIAFFCVLLGPLHICISVNIQKVKKTPYLTRKSDTGPLISLKRFSCFEKYSDNLTNIYHFYYCSIFYLKTAESRSPLGLLQLRSTSENTHKLPLSTDLDKNI